MRAVIAQRNRCRFAYTHFENPEPPKELDRTVETVIARTVARIGFIKVHDKLVEFPLRGEVLQNQRRDLDDDQQQKEGARTGQHANDGAH